MTTVINWLQACLEVVNHGSKVLDFDTGFFAKRTAPFCKMAKPFLRLKRGGSHKKQMRGFEPLV